MTAQWAASATAVVTLASKAVRALCALAKRIGPYRHMFFRVADLDMDIEHFPVRFYPAAEQELGTRLRICQAGTRSRLRLAVFAGCNQYPRVGQAGRNPFAQIVCEGAHLRPGSGKIERQNGNLGRLPDRRRRRAIAENHRPAAATPAASTMANDRTRGANRCGTGPAWTPATVRSRAPPAKSQAL